MARLSGVRHLMKSGGLFFVASLLAGAFNYLYQVTASRELSAPDFSALNAWYAHLAVFFMLGGLLQYAANFYPARTTPLRTAVIFSNIALLVFIWLWPSAEDALSIAQATFIVLAAMASGWLMGQVQIRQQFTVLAITNFVLSACRLAWLWYPLTNQSSPLDRYSLALLISYLPAFWILSFYLWSAPAVQSPRRPGQSPWIGPIILSGAGALIPQFDLLVMNHTQNASVFSDFARVSLFYKAIYFLLFIFAQLVLPRQLHGQISRGVISRLPSLSGAALIGSAILALVSPIVGRMLLGWNDVPEPSLVFLSCLHMSLLTIIFFWIQEQCAQHKPKVAIAILGLMGLEGAAQWALGMPPTPYLYSVIVIQSTVLTLAWRRAKN